MVSESGRNPPTIGYMAALRLLKHAQTEAGSGDDLPIGDGFVLRPSGVWRLAGPDAVRSAIAAPGGGMVKRGLLTDEEFDVLASGPEPDAKAPIVPLPCDASEFIRKLHRAGLLDRLPDDDARKLFWPIRHAVLADMPRRNARRFVRDLRRVVGWLPDEQARILYREVTKRPEQGGRVGAPTGITVRRTGGRTDILSPVIERARAECTDENSAAEVWVVLERWAREKEGPLIGAAEGEIKYVEGGVVKTIGRRALAARLRRRRDAMKHASAR